MDSERRGPRFVRVTRPEIDPDSVQREAEGEPGTPSRSEPRAHHHDTGERARIVVPRQERGRHTSNLDLELREVRWGAASRGAYLRIVPSRREFTSVAPGVVAATRAGSRPRGAAERAIQTAKGIVLGSPFASSQAIHERLTKFRALPIFSSDALSSSAYGPEETLLILVTAGAAALLYSLPISIAIIVLLGIVTLSYRQTIRAYPNGGGAYIVAHENLGMKTGLVAAGSLMVDYVLTVAVSVAAGVAAITSAVPDLKDYAVPMAVIVVGVFTVGNLRGIRESGAIFGLPTYFFIFMMTVLIVTGLAQILSGNAPAGLFQHGPTDDHELAAATGGVTLFLVLKAFSSGSSALTGVEAISNGVPSFQPPEARNAMTTLTIMACILAFLIFGVSLLAYSWGVIPSEEETLLSQLGKDVFGGENLPYYALQVATALVLFLAANTAYAGFPLLAAILAADRVMPRQFTFRGDKLAYSNGIILLALAAIALLIVFDASVSDLIPLYAVGVFVSFTLSQTGMVIHWLRLKGPGWKGGLVISGIGAVATGVVAVIIATTKFVDGAWISILLMSILIVLFYLIHRHYAWYGRVISVDEASLSARLPSATPVESGRTREHMVIPVDGVNKVTMAAVDIARTISPSVTAVHLADDLTAGEDFRERWESLVPDVPMMIIESPYRAFAAPMVAYIELLLRTEPDRKITVILPGFKAHHWWERQLHNQAIRRLHPLLEQYEGVRVLDFDYDVRDTGGSAPPAAPAPASP